MAALLKCLPARYDKKKVTLRDFSTIKLSLEPLCHSLGLKRPTFTFKALRLAGTNLEHDRSELVNEFFFTKVRELTVENTYLMLPST